MSGSPHISVVVLSWNTVDLLIACLRALQADESSKSREIIVVDNASADGSADRVAEQFPTVRLIRNDANLLYSAGNNIGARAATGEFLCLLNSDTEVFPGALDLLCEFLHAHPDYAIASPQLRNPDGSVQSGCRRLAGLQEAVLEWSWFHNTGWARRVAAHARMADFDHQTSRDVEQPLGACMMMRREEYLSLGGLDEQLSLFFNDVDLCVRLQKHGRLVRFLAEARVLHHQGASTRKQDEEFGNPLWHRNRIAFYRKHRGWLGSLVIRTMLRLSTGAMFARIVCGRRSWTAKREALGRLRSFVRRSRQRSPA